MQLEDIWKAENQAREEFQEYLDRWAEKEEEEREWLNQAIWGPSGEE